MLLNVLIGFWLVVSFLNGLLLFCSFLSLDLQDFVLSPLIFHLYVVSLGNHIASHGFNYYLTLLIPKSYPYLLPRLPSWASGLYNCLISFSTWTPINP